MTGIALIPLNLWFVYAVLHLLGAPQWAVHRFVANPFNTVMLLATGRHDVPSHATGFAGRHGGLHG